MGWIVCNEKGIGCLGNLECLMRRADDVKLQERLEGGGHGRPDVSKSHIDTSAGIGRPTAGFSNQRLEPSSFFSGLCTNHTLTTLTITTTLGPSKTLHVYLTIFSQGAFKSAIVGVHHTQETISQRPALSLIASHRHASIRHHKTRRRQADLIGVLNCERARTIVRSAECCHTRERQKTKNRKKVPSLASQKATTCCPLAIVAEGRSATFSSRALHLASPPGASPSDSSVI